MILSSLQCRQKTCTAAKNSCLDCICCLHAIYMLHTFEDSLQRSCNLVLMSMLILFLSSVGLRYLYIFSSKLVQLFSLLTEKPVLFFALALVICITYLLKYCNQISRYHFFFFFKLRQYAVILCLVKARYLTYPWLSYIDDFFINTYICPFRQVIFVQVFELCFCFFDRLHKL